ncbi:MAG TPA: aminoacyl-tRNA hydrolase [Armatimonadota bacterium]|jgi:PTH1 family peptidyl-tRNA hydrolase
MYCLLGLGNPGKEYAATRHNVGWRVVDLLAERHGIRLRAQYNARLGSGQIAGQPVALAQPLTFMNESGAAAARLMQRFELTPPDLVVIYDDLDLDLGRLRVRGSGSPGTHNGVRSVASRLGSRDFPRVRLGIGPRPASVDAADFVLSSFRRGEEKTVEEMIARAAEAVECLVSEGVEKAMNRYNQGGDES